MFDMITFGSAVVDVFVETDMPEKGKFMYYPVGSKILMKSIRFAVGGGGTNTAVAFSRLGFKTGYVGKIGDDVQGREIFKKLKDEKIDFLGKVEKGVMSGYSVILDSRDHDRTVLAYKGANDDLRFSEIPIGKIKTKWMYCSSMLGDSFETQKKTVKILTKWGTKVAFNPSEYLIKNYNILPMLKMTEVLAVNKEEAEMILEKYKIKNKDLLEGLWGLGPRIVVVTDKNRPIRAYDGNKKYSLKTHTNVKVVERTGAGDALASGFVAGLMAGWDIGKSLRLGLKESESVISHVGAKDKLLRMKLKVKG